MSSPLVEFRKFAIAIRQPSSYCPIVTELKGIANLGLGPIQLIVSQYMKYSSNKHYNSLADKHWQIGSEAVYRGVVQLMPSILIGGGSLYFARKVTDLTYTMY